MSKVHVTAKRDFLESLTVSRPLAAVAELVWNGFDAQSDAVRVILDLNALGGLHAIRVQDHGRGISHPDIEALFGNLGDSWKKTAGRHQGRALHGKAGKGRFRAFALGTLVEWKTTYQHNGSRFSYAITGRADALDDFDVTDPVETAGAVTGTEVVVSNLKGDFGSLLAESAPQEMAELFAAYLTEYPGLTLEYSGMRVDPKDVQDHRADYPLGDLQLANGQRAFVTVSVVEWTMPTDRTIHLCDAKGIALHQIQAGQQIRAPGFSFTVYVKSDHLRELDKQNLLQLDELHPDVASILKAARDKVKEHFRRRLLEDQGHVVERWKEERIYPYEDKAILDPVETAERQVFEILAVNVESYLPSFEGADIRSRRFTFRLLAQAIRENPGSVQQIIAEILGLKKEEQDELAALLRKTPLSSIISTARTVANRLDFLAGLETLLFDPENKRRLLERDQLHRVLEGEAWLFHEGFALAGSEERLGEVLQKHLGLLGEREDAGPPVELPGGGTGRVDLMLHKVIQPRAGEYDYLVVELKRPSRKIDDEVLTQVKKYAMAVAGDERFHGVPARWTFVAVSNELDEFVDRDSRQRGRPVGQVYDDAERNVTVWVRPWAEVINDARARLRFVNTQLAYEADRESAKAYLKRTHAKFIPDLDRLDEEDSPKGELPSETSLTPRAGEKGQGAA